MQQKYDIVLVEDNMEDAELTIRALKKNNLNERLLHLKDGAAALEFFNGNEEYKILDERFPPKLVLLDIKMPKVDGLEVLRVIKSSEKTKMIPVVLFTSSREEKDIKESFENGANSYVVKPVDYDGFMQVIAQLSTYWLQVNQQSLNVQN